MWHPCLYQTRLLFYFDSLVSPCVFCYLLPAPVFPTFIVPWFSPASHCRSCPWLFSLVFPCHLVYIVPISLCRCLVIVISMFHLALNVCQPHTQLSKSPVLDLLPWEDTFCPVFLSVTQTVCIWHLSATPVLDILFPLLLYFQTADVLFTYFKK